MCRSEGHSKKKKKPLFQKQTYSKLFCDNKIDHMTSVWFLLLGISLYFELMQHWWSELHLPTSLHITVGKRYNSEQ